MKKTIKILPVVISLILLLGLNNGSFAQERSNKIINLIESYSEKDDATFFETTEEMFKLLAKNIQQNQDPRMLEYFRKTKYISSLQVNVGNANNSFIDGFKKKADLSNYNLLMRSKSKSRNYSFYKKDLEDKTSEYLLIHRSGVYYMITGMDISTLEEMAGVVEMVGRAGS
ncbi:DUF4252 domain-containing protein [Roseivirga misakiensis]|uniref:DUF4252 domain-containing protein n=1 Tax=Roseivirga misakiensis TaxID=1563681 RepID=A0A1E5T0K7_9BACT|nr:DUF4252 domain-containing protein [Roseivirga misakiensis]OEK04886.1 hypothetical protein BFP71_15720 [Roseivirga misakiensis]